MTKKRKLGIKAVPNCRSLRDNDQWYCPVKGCGLRWDVGELWPKCPLKGTHE